MKQILPAQIRTPIYAREPHKYTREQKKGGPGKWEL